jgi:polar amino acid transport system substrate-binding protein
MFIFRRSFLVLMLLYALLLGCGCVTEQPPGSVPTTAVPATNPISSLTFYTEQLPPYSYLENGIPRGISVDLLEAVTEKMGAPLSPGQVHVVPWNEGYQAALTGKNSVISSTAKLPERESAFKWAGPIAFERKVLFARPDRGIVVTGPADLKDLRIGVIKDDVVMQQLLEAGVNESRLVQETNASLLAEQLRSGGIDLWGIVETPGRSISRQVTGDPDAFVVAYAFPTASSYYAFSRDVPDATVQSFQQALDFIKTDKNEKGFTGYEGILYNYLGVRCTRTTITDAEVMNLVNTTAAAIAQNTTDTFRRINAEEAPYRDSVNPALYVFVFDTNTTIVAQADNVRQVGVNFRGKTDVTGKAFRDEIVSGALRNGSGWVDYVFSSPTETGLYYKTSYYRAATGSDNQVYIIGSGIYKACEA